MARGVGDIDHAEQQALMKEDRRRKWHSRDRRSAGSWCTGASKVARRWCTARILSSDADLQVQGKSESGHFVDRPDLRSYRSRAHVPPMSASSQLKITAVRQRARTAAQQAGSPERIHQSRLWVPRIGPPVVTWDSRSGGQIGSGSGRVRVRGFVTGLSDLHPVPRRPCPVLPLGCLQGR